MMTKFQKLLENFEACDDARWWVGTKTPQEAWETCIESEWMFWILRRTSVDKQLLVKLAADMALSIMHLNDDPEVAEAIDAAEAWCEKDSQENRAAINEKIKKYMAVRKASSREASYVACAAFFVMHVATAPGSYDCVGYLDTITKWALLAAETVAVVREPIKRDICNLIRARIPTSMFLKLIAKL